MKRPAIGRLCAWILVLAAGAAAAWYALRGHSESQQSGPAAEGIPAVEVAPPQRATLARRIEVPATIDPVEQAEVHARASGYLQEIRVDIGDRVKQGDVLAVIDEPDVEDDLREAKAEQTAKVSQAAAAAAAVEQTQRAIATQEQLLAQKEAALHLQEVTQKRKEELFTGRGISKQELDEARTAGELAAADVSVGRARLAAAQSDQLAAQAAEAVARAQIEVTAAKVSKIETLRGYARIVAPFAGIVTRRPVDRGDLVQAGTTGRATALFTVQRDDPVRVVLQVPELQAALVKPHTRAAVRPYSSRGAPIEGEVTRTASSLEASRSMRAEIELANPSGQLLTGMYAQVTLVLEQHDDVLSVPAAAVGTEGAERTVFTVENDKAVRHVVTTGIEDGGRIEIVSGLAEDAQVIVTGRSAVKPGMPVRVVRKP